MAYIGKVKVSKDWTSIESLVQEQVEGQSSFAFDSSKTYQLQAESDTGCRLVEMASTPDDRKDGNCIIGTQCAYYKKDTGNLYVRSVANTDASCLLKISTVGE